MQHDVIDAESSDLATRNRDSVGLAKVQSPNDFLAIIDKAVQANMDPAALHKMMDLYERLETRNAVQKFNAAFADFKRECPPIPRRSENQQFQVTRNGVRRNARFASLEDIERIVRPILGRYGLTYRWGDQRIVGDMLALDCIVAHVGGHSERATSFVPIASKAGSSEQQKMGAAQTYAKRFSVNDALGLVSTDEDLDAEADATTHGPTVTEEQAANIQATIDSIGTDADDRRGLRDATLAYARVKRLADIPADAFASVMKKLDVTRRARGGK